MCDNALFATLLCLLPVFYFSAAHPLSQVLPVCVDELGVLDETAVLASGDDGGGGPGVRKALRIPDGGGLATGKLAERLPGGVALGGVGGGKAGAAVAPRERRKGQGHPLRPSRNNPPPPPPSLNFVTSLRCPCPLGSLTTRSYHHHPQVQTVRSQHRAVRTARAPRPRGRQKAHSDTSAAPEIPPGSRNITRRGGASGSAGELALAQSRWRYELKPGGFRLRGGTDTHGAHAQSRPAHHSPSHPNAALRLPGRTGSFEMTSTLSSVANRPCVTRPRTAASPLRPLIPSGDSGSALRSPPLPPEPARGSARQWLPGKSATKLGPPPPISIRRQTLQPRRIDGRRWLKDC